jgi:hypothetical protein
MKRSLSTPHAAVPQIFVREPHDLSGNFLRSQPWRIGNSYHSESTQDL